MSALLNLHLNFLYIEIQYETTKSPNSRLLKTNLEYIQAYAFVCK